MNPFMLFGIIAGAVAVGSSVSRLMTPKTKVTVVTADNIDNVNKVDKIDKADK